MSTRTLCKDLTAQETNEQKNKNEQYSVRGKSRNYQVLVFPKPNYMWAFYDSFDEQYEIDGDKMAFQHVKYAMAALIACPDKIVYFPIRSKSTFKCYEENYDAVISRPEAQLKRSEWVQLRRQLDRIHRIHKFVLDYDEDKLCAYWEKNAKRRYYDAYSRKKQEVNELLGSTVFMTLLEDSCYTCHQWITTTERQEEMLREPSDPIYTRFGYFGWLLAQSSIEEMLANSKSSSTMQA